MSYSVLKADIARIYLDNNNPRHDPIQNEPEIISHLIANENIKPLARHIAAAGTTSPLEKIAVIAHPKVKNAYIAAEGNRRICALKLLADPDKADTEANKKYFRTLAATMAASPGEMDVILFKDMDAAEPWIALRHEGEQGGVGTKAWDPQQTARFKSKNNAASNPNIQASLLVDYARIQHLLSKEQLNGLSITTLTRYLSNPVFRDTLGLIDNKTLTINVPADEFNKVVTRFLTDALNPDSGVTSRTTVDDRKTYANSLRTEQAAPVTRGQPPVDLGNTQQAAAANSPASKTATPAPRNNRSPDDRKRVIPSTFIIKPNDKTLKRLYDELRMIDPDEFSFSATYLLRAVIEQMATLFLKQNSGGAPKELHQKLGEVAKILETQGMTGRQLKALRTMANDKDSRYSADSIGHFVHGGAIPTKTDAIKLWDSIEPVITEIAKQLK